jgi:hypothetical protein
VAGLFIEDGQTEPGYIAAEERLYPELRFTYRPMRKEDRDVFKVGTMALGPSESVAKTVEELVNRMPSWEAKVPVSAERIRKLRPQLLDKLIAIVWGYLPPDADPRAAPQEKEALLEDKFCGGSAAQAVPGNPQ